MTRRTFVGGLAATGVLKTWAKASEEIRALLLHLGHNMWCDWIPPDIDRSCFEKGLPDLKLRSRDDYWREVTDYAAIRGLNMIVVDVGEGLVYPSHPELAIEGSWSPEKLKGEVARLKSIGLEAIPKLNFSTTHNGWLKQYRRMLSTPTYYKVCEDVLADVHEVFGHPRFVHIGCDEEMASHQLASKRTPFVIERTGEFWWHDFLHIVRTVERLGARAWAWSDYGWDHWEAFEKRCPRSVLLSNWYYDECYGGFDRQTNKTADLKRLQNFYNLDAAGFEQVPCGTNWVGWIRKREKVGADDVMGKLVALCRKDISGDLLKGFMMAPWASCDTPENVAFNRRGIDLFAEAVKQ